MHCLSTVTVMSFNWLLCKLLMLHQVSSMSTPPWWCYGSFFHYSPKYAESLKVIQKVLDLPELKIVKPSDTHWLAHEHCVQAVKASYSSIVLKNIYETSHGPEALGLSKAPSSHSTIAAMYLLDYILPQVAKLSRALQTKHLVLSLICSLVAATLNSLDDAILPSANWVLQLQDAREGLKAATAIEGTHLDICSFQERVGKPFIRLIKDNISSQFRSSSNVFDPKKVSSLSTHEPPLYGNSSIQTLVGQFERNLPAKSLAGTEFEKAAIVSSDLSTEWKTYHQLLIKQPKDDISMQPKELLTNDMLIALFSNIHKLATNPCLFPFLQHQQNKVSQTWNK